MEDSYAQLDDVNKNLIVSIPSPARKRTPVVKPLRKTRWRWVALLLMNLLILGNFASMDSPQPIQTQLQQILNISDHQYSLLYSTFAFPSIIIPFIGGYLTDKLGVRPALLAFSIAITLGQCVYALGGLVKNFGFLLAGRAIYAIGSDPLNVAQICITNKWFKGKEVGIAMALSTTTLGLGRAINSFLTPKLFVISQNLFVPMAFSAIFCTFSLVCAIVMIILDIINDKREKSYIRMSNPSPDLPHQEEENISLKDIRYFKPIVWLCIFNFGLANGVFSSFNAFTNDLYHTQYNFSNSQAGLIISIGFIVTTISSAIFGKLVDSHGKRASMIMYSSFLCVFAYIFFIVVPECNQCYTTILPQVFYGLFLGIEEAAVFPALALVLDEKYLGTGLGFFFVTQNIFLLGLPYIAATIKEDYASNVDNGYFQMYIFFGIWSLLTAAESVAIFVLDKLKHESILEQKTIMKQSEATQDIESIRR